MRNYYIFLFVLFHLFALQSNSQVYNPISYTYNGTPTNGIKIKTNMPYCSGCQMPTIIFEGYNYGGQAPIGLTLTYYIYNDNFWYPKVSSWGAYTPVVKLANESNKVVIFIDDRGYFQRFNVRAFATGMSEDPSWFTGWTIVDEPISGTNITQANYQNNFAGVVNLPGGGYWNTDGNVVIKGTYANPQEQISYDGSNGLFFQAQGTSIHTNWLIGQQRLVNGGLEFTPSTAPGNKTFQSPVLVLKSDGDVGIGTLNPRHELDVSGIIRANEVIVNTEGADFVFDSDYILPELIDVEKFINQNKHLPGILPASEMQKEGMKMSEMQTKLLQKIEELTLYSIEQNKRIEELNNQIKQLKEIINGLQ